MEQAFQGLVGLEELCLGPSLESFSPPLWTLFCLWQAWSRIVAFVTAFSPLSSGLALFRRYCRTLQQIYSYAQVHLHGVHHDPTPLYDLCLYKYMIYYCDICKYCIITALSCIIYNIHLLCHDSLWCFKLNHVAGISTSDCISMACEESAVRDLWALLTGHAETKCDWNQKTWPGAPTVVASCS